MGFDIPALTCLPRALKPGKRSAEAAGGPFVPSSWAEDSCASGRLVNLCPLPSLGCEQDVQ